MVWPTSRGWGKNASGLVCLMKSYRGFWAVDFDLKYLNLCIDTRFDEFYLTDRDNKPIHPDRVLEAIDRYCHLLDAVAVEENIVSEDPLYVERHKDTLRRIEVE